MLHEGTASCRARSLCGSPANARMGLFYDVLENEKGNTVMSLYSVLYRLDVLIPLSPHLRQWFSAFGLQPFGGVELPFPRSYLRPSENTNIYITIHNSSKITVVK